MQVQVRHDVIYAALYSELLHERTKPFIWLLDMAIWNN
jgi:hypothetical protein